MTTTAVLYIRVSTDDQETSVEMQRAKLLAYADMRGVAVAEVVVDEDVNGGIPMCERPGGARALALLKARKASAIVALKLDRLFRSASDALTKVELWEKQRAALHLVDMGGSAIDTSTPTGKMMITMLAGFAEFERATIRERTRSALRHKRDTGRAYNHAPLGFDHVQDGTGRDGEPTYRMVPNAAEQAVVARIKALRAEGRSMGKIAAVLNAEGLKGKTGGAFHASTIKAVLDNPLHA